MVVVFPAGNRSFFVVPSNEKISITVGVKHVRLTGAERLRHLRHQWMQRHTVLASIDEVCSLPQL
jgi:hypothetical protein